MNTQNTNVEMVLSKKQKRKLLQQEEEKSGIFLNG